MLFALVAQRALTPGSEFAATGWVAHRVAVPGCPLFTDDGPYVAILLEALPEIAGSGRSRACSTSICI